MGLGELITRPLLRLTRLTMPHGRCEFADTCVLYNEDNDPCNKTAGSYYGPGRGGGCYRERKQQSER